MPKEKKIRAIICIAAMLTMALLFLHINRRAAEKRETSIEFYERQIYDLECRLITANSDLELSQTPIERTAAKKEISDLEREIRQLRNQIHKLKNDE